MIVFGALLPHPPIMVEGIGRPEDLAEIAGTIRAAREINRRIAENPPETIVIFTPHGTVFGDAVVVYGSPALSGNLNRFGLKKTWKWENDLDLATVIQDIGQLEDLPVYVLDQDDLSRYQASREGLDHGVLVPLSFIEGAWTGNVKLVVVPLSFLPLEDLYRFGSIVRKAAESLERKIAVIASGDLSHALQPGAPGGYDPRGAEFDQLLIKMVEIGDVAGLFDIDPVLREKAAECGFRSLIMLLGALDETRFTTEVLSYEGPFGVGYGVASFVPRGPRESLIGEILGKRQQAIDSRRAGESPLVRYARQVVEAYAQDQSLPEPDGLDGFQNEQAGTFVSIKKHGQLRGCIGTTEPTQPNIVKEVLQNAISASTRDPRFTPVSVEELPDLVYSVDILKPAEPIDGLDDLDPERYGVIVSKGFRKGLLLPRLEGIETAAEQVRIAKQKAGIEPDEPAELERFEVIRHH